MRRSENRTTEIRRNQGMSVFEIHCYLCPQKSWRNNSFLGSVWWISVPPGLYRVNWSTKNQGGGLSRPTNSWFLRLSATTRCYRKAEILWNIGILFAVFSLLFPQLHCVSFSKMHIILQGCHDIFQAASYFFLWRKPICVFTSKITGADWLAKNISAFSYTLARLK